MKSQFHTFMRSFKTRNEALGYFKPDTTLVEVVRTSSQARYEYQVHPSSDSAWELVKSGPYSYHETILGDFPCRIYLDIEFKKEFQPDIRDVILEITKHLEKRLDKLPPPLLFSACREGVQSYHLTFDKWVPNPSYMKELLVGFDSQYYDSQVYPNLGSVKSLRFPFAYKIDSGGNQIHQLLPVDPPCGMSDYEIFIKGSVCVGRPDDVINVQPEANMKRIRVADDICEEMSQFLDWATLGSRYGVKRISEGVETLTLKRCVCPFKLCTHARNNQYLVVTNRNIVMKCYDEECQGLSKILVSKCESYGWNRRQLYNSQLFEYTHRLTELMKRCGKIWFTTAAIGMHPVNHFSIIEQEEEFEYVYGLKWAVEAYEQGLGRDIKVVSWDKCIDERHLSDVFYQTDVEIKQSAYVDFFNSVPLCRDLEHYRNKKMVVCVRDMSMLQPRIVSIFLRGRAPLFMKNGVITKDTTQGKMFDEVGYGQLEEIDAEKNGCVYLLIFLHRYTPFQYVEMAKKITESNIKVIYIKI